MFPVEVANLGGRVATVLVVEDEFLIRTAVAAELRSAGLDVFEAGDCAEALEVLATHPEIELLFTDIAMPGSRDGNYLISFARVEYPRIVVIAATAHPASGLVDGALQKPYDPADAVALIRKLMHKKT